MRKSVAGYALLMVVLAGASQAQLGDLTKRLGVGSGSGLSDAQIGSGLKDALKLGTENAVKLTGHPGGYSDNPSIRIPLPKDLHPLESGLRAMGQGPKIDEFVLSMNRAAEAAAPAAREIFGNAVAAMTIEDARKILSGGDTAATDYFKSKTSDQLTTAFTPYVEQAMKTNSVSQQFDALTGQATQIPFMKSPSLNINHYVVSKAMEGLFYEVGQEEKKIRTDPAARTTTLLKQVFSSGR